MATNVAKGGTTGRARRGRNRRRRNRVKGALAVLTGLLVLECAAALRFSPRFEVRPETVSIAGNSEVPTEAVAAHLALTGRDNLFLLPVERMAERVRELAQVERVEVRRTLPNRLRVVVTERIPFASLQDGQGRWFLCDARLVPYRRLEKPEPGLPQVAFRRVRPAEYVIGLPVATGDEARQVRDCLAWAGRHPEAKVASLRMDAAGNLCLNSDGGVPVQLGVGRRLDTKLEVLSALIRRHPEVLDGAKVAYVNLVADNRPAVCPRTLSGTPSSQQAEP